MRTVLSIIIATLLSGCASSDVPLNPSFPLTVDQGWDEVHAMEASPKRLERPVIVLGGYVDPGSAPIQTAMFIESATGDKRVMVVNTTLDFSFNAARDHVIEAIEEAFPSSDPHATVEVDVVAHSMGGLVARYAALDRAAPLSPWEKAGVRAATNNEDLTSDADTAPSPKRLRIHRLFSICVPHRGADTADLPFFDPRQHAMRRGSRMLQQLDAALETLDYQIIPYTRLGDSMVGDRNAAPWGQRAWWVQNLLGDSPHFNSSNDPRILADILRRLRGEPHYTTSPPAPLPYPDAE